MQTGVARDVTADDKGNFSALSLIPGVYSVEVTAPSFQKQIQENLRLEVAGALSLTFRLTLGQVAESIKVEAQGELLKSTEGVISTTIDNAKVVELPLNGRNFNNLVRLTPGATRGVNGGGPTLNAQTWAVTGSRSDNSNYTLDGTFNNGSFFKTAAIAPSIDAIQEFKIQTSTYDASFGRNPGANVNVVTKSGTNQFHGSAFEFFRNEKLNANDFFYNRDSLASRTQKQVLKQNQFGGAIGGPVKKDKIFFFGSYQGTRQRNGVAAQGITSATVYPIPDNRESTDFTSRLGAAMCGYAARGLQIACNGSNINPVAVALLRVKLPDGSYYIPSSGTNTTAQRLISLPAKYSENQYIANMYFICRLCFSVSR